MVPDSEVIIQGGGPGGTLAGSPGRFPGGLRGLNVDVKTFICVDLCNVTHADS